MINKTLKETQLSDGTKISDLVDAEKGIISPRIFSDQEIYDLEQEKIFSKVWNFVAHETEIPNEGDYVTRFVANDPVIVVREAENKINVLLNVCMHKGMHLCRTDAGNTKNFRCIYHGWTYKSDGTLMGAPAAKEAYKGAFDRNQFKLVNARVERYAGLIFATFNQDAPSLDEYLGDMKWYIDLYFNRTPLGMEVLGEPARWIIKANWKSAADNFASDSYHTVMTHYSGVELGQLPPNPMFASFGVQVAMENGHGIGVIGAPPNIPLPEYLALPQEIVEAAHAKLTEPQLEALRRSNFVPGNVFPNFSLLNVMQLPGLEENEYPVPFMSMRVWQPKGPNEFELLSWFLVEKEAPQEFKEASRDNYIRNFGASGMFEADDAEVWSGIARVTKGVTAKKELKLHYIMGLDAEHEPGNWPGPGKKIAQTTYTEQNSRNFFGYWAKLMSEES